MEAVSGKAVAVMVQPPVPIDASAGGCMHHTLCRARHSDSCILGVDVAGHGLGRRCAATIALPFLFLVLCVQTTPVGCAGEGEDGANDEKNQKKRPSPSAPMNQAISPRRGGCRPSGRRLTDARTAVVVPRHSLQAGRSISTPPVCPPSVPSSAARAPACPSAGNVPRLTDIPAASGRAGAPRVRCLWDLESSICHSIPALLTVIAR